MITSKTTWIVLAVLILTNIFLASVYGFFMYKISLEHDNIAKSIASLTKETRRESDLQALSSVLKMTETERAKIDSYFVTEQGTAHFLENIQKLGGKAGVDLNLSDVGIESKEDLRINFSAGGSFGNMYKLLELMEKTPYAISFRSFNLNKVNISSAKTGPSQPWSGSFSIHLNSFSGK